jgi:hypothetical protein
MSVAYPRTMTVAKRAFYGWPPSKKDDAIAECVAKLWDSWSRLLLRGRDPQRMLSGLIKYAILWVRYDRRISGRARTPDLFDHRSRFKRQLLSDQGEASPSDRSDPGNAWINWQTDTGDSPVELAAALEESGLSLEDWLGE